MAATLRLSGSGPAIVVEIEKATTTIGRHGDFKTPYHHTSVSRLHCAILQHGGGYKVRDLNSYSGTVVTGDWGMANLKSTDGYDWTLSDGDKISLGNHVVVVYKEG